MQYFQDSTTSKVYAFEDGVTVSDSSKPAKTVTWINGTPVAGTVGPYTFRTLKGEILQAPAPLVPIATPQLSDAEKLAAARTLQVALLKRACTEHITAAFSSDALGTAYTYGSAETDQRNLQSAALAAASAGAGWETPEWCCSAGGTAWALKQHTAAQIIQVHNDLLAFISAARVRLAALTASVASETTVAAVQAITW